MKKAALLTVGLLSVSALSGFAAEPKENWEQHCAKCHGSDGKGDTKMGKKLEVRDYTDATVKASIKDDEALKALKEGLTKDGKQLMKAFSPAVSDDELKALIAYMRTL